MCNICFYANEITFLFQTEKILGPNYSIIIMIIIIIYSLQKKKKNLILIYCFPKLNFLCYYNFAIFLLYVYLEPNPIEN